MMILHRSSAADSSASRLYLLDELRGFAVLCMVFFHGFYAMSDFFSLKAGTVLYDFFLPAEPWFAGLFILISGICCRLSHSNALRGAKLLGVSAGVTLVTLGAVWVGILDYPIWFGILHLLAVSMLLFALLDRIGLMNKIPPLVGFFVLLVLFVLTYSIDEGTIGIPYVFSVRLPQSLYFTNWLAPLGFHAHRFSSSDYFPILPWTLLFLAGSFLGVYARSGRFPRIFYRRHCRPAAFVGRHALLIYLAHQPVIYGILWIL